MASQRASQALLIHWLSHKIKATTLEHTKSRILFQAQSYSNIHSQTEHSQNNTKRVSPDSILVLSISIRITQRCSTETRAISQLMVQAWLASWKRREIKIPSSISAPPWIQISLFLSNGIRLRKKELLWCQMALILTSLATFTSSLVASQTQIPSSF